jgi:hypothetical protein
MIKLGILARWVRYFNRLLNDDSELITQQIEQFEEAVVYPVEDHTSLASDEPGQVIMGMRSNKATVQTS